MHNSSGTTACASPLDTCCCHLCEWWQAAKNDLTFTGFVSVGHASLRLKTGVCDCVVFATISVVLQIYEERNALTAWKDETSVSSVPAVMQRFFSAIIQRWRSGVPPVLV